jgi:hypothetical protein
MLGPKKEKNFEIPSSTSSSKLVHAVSACLYSYDSFLKVDLVFRVVRESQVT